MRRRLTTGAAIAVLVGVPVLAVAAATPAEAALACASTATVTSVRDLTSNHSGTVIRYGQETPTGGTWTGHTMQRAHFYELHGVALTVAFGKATYRIDRNAIVSLSCSGASVGSPLKDPMLDLMRGRATVRDPSGYYGSVDTFEALVNPVEGSHRAMTFTVTRALTQKMTLSISQKITWYAGFINQPQGTTRATTSGAPQFNVTPYVGPRPGSCRQVHFVSLTSTGTSGGYPKGTASYHR